MYSSFRQLEQYWNKYQAGRTDKEKLLQCFKYVMGMCSVLVWGVEEGWLWRGSNEIDFWWDILFPNTAGPCQSCITFLSLQGTGTACVSIAFIVYFKEKIVSNLTAGYGVERLLLVFRLRWPLKCEEHLLWQVLCSSDSVHLPYRPGFEELTKAISVPRQRHR